MVCGRVVIPLLAFAGGFCVGGLDCEGNKVVGSSSESSSPSWVENIVFLPRAWRRLGAPNTLETFYKIKKEKEKRRTGGRLGVLFLCGLGLF